MNVYLVIPYKWKGTRELTRMFTYAPLPIYSEIPQTDIQQKFCLCMLSTITQLT